MQACDRNGRGDVAVTKGDGNIDLIPHVEAVVCEDSKIISRAEHANCPSCRGRGTLEPGQGH